MWAAQCRPNKQDIVDYADQLLAGRTGRSLHGQSEIDSLNESREGVDVSALRQITFGDGSLESPAQIGMTGGALCIEFRLQRVAVAG